MKLDYVPIESLIPYARNSRTHNKNQVRQIADSIEEFGFTNPVLIDEKNIIIAGHGRVLAAALINLKEIPCIILTELSDKQKIAYRIADNKLAMNAGCASYRNIDEEMRQLNLLQAKWGDKIVKIDNNNRSHNLIKTKKRVDYNPIIKVPIGGV